MVRVMQSDSLREENAALRRQCLEYESQAAALQNEAAEHVRTISAANAQVKLLQSKVRLIAALHCCTALNYKTLWSAAWQCMASAWRVGCSNVVVHHSTDDAGEQQWLCQRLE